MPNSSKRMPAIRATLLAISISACSSPAAQDTKRQPTPAPTSTPAAAPPTPPAAPAPAEQAPRVSKGPKVAFLGDSISAGLHLPSEQAYPAVLQRILAERGSPFELLNAGVSGDTTAGGLRRVDWILKQQPAIVVVELGANDGMRGQPVADIEQNLRTIIQHIRDRGAQPLLLGMRIPPSYGHPYAENFDAIYPRIAKDLTVPFVPFFMQDVATNPALNLPDGIHPTKQGHELLANRVADALTTLITHPNN